MSFTEKEIRLRLGILNNVLETTDPNEPKLAEVKRQIAALEAQLAAIPAASPPATAPAAGEPQPETTEKSAGPPPVIVGMRALSLSGRARK